GFWKLLPEALAAPSTWQLDGHWTQTATAVFVDGSTATRGLFALPLATGSPDTWLAALNVELAPGARVAVWITVVPFRLLKNGHTAVARPWASTATSAAKEPVAATGLSMSASTWGVWPVNEPPAWR